MATPERVVIAAAGVVTPIGQDLEAFWSSLVTGASGISQIERVPVADLRVQRGGEVKKIGRIKDWRGVPDCRASRLLIAAADDLCTQTAFHPLPLDPARVGVVVGTALGGVEEGEKALAGDRDPRRLSQALYDAPGWALARWLGARGPVITVSTACASGATALAVGADLLRAGEADAVVAGGYDALCRFVLRGFDVLRSLTRDEVRPFDRRRSGLLLGEAGALALLVRERDARGPRLGTLLGYGSASDGFHIAAPEPEGRGLERAIRAALADARVSAARHRPGERARNRHAAQRPDRDGGPQASPRPPGPRDPDQLHQGQSRPHDGRRRRPRGLHVSALGSAGPDPAHAAPGGARSGVRSRLCAGPRAPRTPSRHAEHVHGLRRLQRRHRPRGRLMGAPAIRGLGVLTGQAKSADRGSAGATTGNTTQVKSADRGSAGAISGPPHMEGLKKGTVDSRLEILTLPRPDRPGDRFRRATRECLLALAAVDAMLEDGNASREVIAGERTALMYVTAAAYGASNRAFIERQGGVMHFAYTAPAVVPAEVAIEFGVAGPYGILIGGAPATLRAIEQAARLLEAGTCDRVLVLAVEIFEECADLYARHRRSYPGPLVETAACLWLERGEGAISFESARAGRRVVAGARPGERFSAGPLADLRDWRAQATGGSVELSGRWRGEHARLHWSPEISHARGSAA